MAATSQTAREELLLEIPDAFLCAITQEVMRDPVICADGHTYERIAIETWLRGHRTSPRTNAPLSHTTLIPNIALRQAIEVYMRAMPEIQRADIQRRQEVMDLQEIIQLREMEAKNFKETVQLEREQLTRTLMHLEEKLRIEITRREQVEVENARLKASVVNSTPNLQINPIQLQEFLNYVVSGQQDEAESLLRQSPELAHGIGTVTDHANRTFKNITGFQYAVWALDWHMWRMIRKYLPIEEARFQADGFCTGSWIKKHGEHIDMGRLIDNYQTLLDHWPGTATLKHAPWSGELFNAYWLQEIGGVQRALPIHVIQEYCQPDRSFAPIPNFKEDVVLTRKLPEWVNVSHIGKIYVISRGGESVLTQVHNRIPGFLMHGSDWSPAPGFTYFMSHNFNIDRAAMVAFTETRLQQREELITELRRLETLRIDMARSSGVHLAAIKPQHSSNIPQYQTQMAQIVKTGVVETLPQIHPTFLQTFLNHVVSGQQDEAEALLKQTPELALGADTVTDHGGRTFENITGFQYAAWALDWHMWQMIRKYLPIEAARLQVKDFGVNSWVKEHGEYVSLKKLIDSYQVLINNWSLWPVQQINEHWLQEIGEAQRILPMHVIQEYCQPSRSFCPAINFREDVAFVRMFPEWCAPAFVAELGRDFAILRSNVTTWQDDRSSQFYTVRKFNEGHGMPRWLVALDWRGRSGTMGACSLCSRAVYLSDFENDFAAITLFNDTRVRQRLELITELTRECTPKLQ